MVDRQPTPGRSGLAAALDDLGDRWSLRIIDALLDGPQTFGELEVVVEGIAASTLSARLKRLEAVAVLLASPYSQRPVRYGYELTAAGRELGSAVRLLAAWGEARRGGEPHVRHDACGTPAEARWWCPTCDRPADVTDLHHC